MYEKILVPLDGSKLAECVLPHVESLAKGGQVKGVIFVRVAEPVQPPLGGDEDLAFSIKDWKRVESQHRAAAQKYLLQLVSQLKYGDVSVKSEVIVGKAAESIADYVTKNEVDLIVIATHGRSGVSRWVWGSVADRILHSVCVPVLMVRAPGCIPGI